MSAEDRLRELISEAYGDLHLTKPLRDIEAAARWRPRRRATAWAAAGTAGVIGAVAFAATPTPQGSVSVSATPSASSTATAPAGLGCGRVHEPMPPLRFTVSDLELYADEKALIACYRHGGSPGAVARMYDAMRVQRPGGAMSSMLEINGERIGFAIGPVPAGKTGVQVFFKDGTSVAAQIDDGWYVATGTGADADRFADVTRVGFTP